MFKLNVDLSLRTDLLIFTGTAQYQNVCALCSRRFATRKNRERTIYCQTVIVNPKVTDVPLLVFAAATEI